MKNDMIKETEPKRSIWLLLISLMLMFFGVYTVLNPDTALVTSAVLIGLLFIIMGITYLIEYWQCRSVMCPALGLLDIIIGVILLANLGLTAIGLPIILGFWCIFAGITQFVGGLQLHYKSSPEGKTAMLTGFLGMLFGILIFLYPLFGVFVISFLVGAYFIIYGAFELNRYLKK